MKIAVVGPGAMGCLFAALLKEARHEVWLIDKRAERAEQLGQTGIRIEGIGGRRTVRVHATGAPGTIEGVDLVFIWVKAYDTRIAAEWIVPLLTERTQIATLQNGLGNMEAIASVARMGSIIGGTTAHGATLLDRGCIRYTGKGETVIGRIDKQKDAKLEEVARLLSDAGIETRVSQDIERAIWSKLIVNAAINPITAITRLKNGDLLKTPETRALLDLVAQEAGAIVAKAGIALAYPDPRERIYAVCEATAQNRSSMLQDVLNGRRTEIDAINGALIEKAGTLHVPAPVNETLTHLVKAIEGASKKPPER